MRRSRIATAALSVLVAVGLAGCGSSSGGYGSPTPTTKPGTTAPGTTAPGTTAPTGSGAATATIANYAFSIPASVKAGQAFTVTNTDGVTHTFSNPDGAFDARIAGGASAQVTIAAAGTYTVVCKIHSSMRATITVTS